MKRRDLIVGALIAVTVRRAQAQQTGKVYRIAIVTPATPVAEIGENNRNPYIARAYRAFFDELRRLGYVEGQNLVVERYSGEGRPEHYPELAREVVGRNPDVIWAISPQVLIALKAATATIPIVGLGSDPVALGIVSSLARPGGNITGVSVDAGFEVWGKRLELLKEAVPTLSRLGLLVTRTASGSRGAAVVKEASEKLGISLVGSPLDSPIDEAAYRRAFAAMAQEGADALFVGSEAENDANLRIIVDLADKSRLPAVYSLRGAAEIGGLMAYAYDLLDVARHNAEQIDQIFRGANPGDIPIYRAIKFELVINLRTAKALGLTIPPALLVRADEVIE
jgi:putative tryptophan/tyrosine transport system substrate-binding protein